MNSQFDEEFFDKKQQHVLELKQLDEERSKFRARQSEKVQF